MPIAVGTLAAAEQMESAQLEEFIITGELALTGAVCSVKGVLPIALRARAGGKRGLLVPAENGALSALALAFQIQGALS